MTIHRGFFSAEGGSCDEPQYACHSPSHGIASYMCITKKSFD